MNNPFAIVITSLLSDTAAIKKYSEKCSDTNSEIFVIGDKKSKKSISFDNCNYYSLNKQNKLPYKYTSKCPINNYARKNIGYLEAIRSGYEIIVETDDDNYPKENFWKERNLKQRVSVLKGKGWINIYSYFSNKRIWPRGFPPDMLGVKNPVMKKESTVEICPIQQGLVDSDPDVDAIYRMTIGEDVKFFLNRRLTLRKNLWSPFNSQNTTWFKVAFPLMYLPSYCSISLTDIWRSFIAQRIAWTCGWKILFHSPNVYQERNKHDLLTDFEDELPGYKFNKTIRTSLEDVELKDGVGNIYDNLFSCYELMVKNKWIGSKELKLLELWINDLESISNIKTH